MLPVFLTLLLLVLQPVCLLYTSAVMEATAGETARLMITAKEGDVEACRLFALRRLEAVPNLAIFHEGGPDAWDITCKSADDLGGSVRVEISGSVRPLPILGVFIGALSSVNADGVYELHTKVCYRGRPSWLEGNYGSWIEVWK